VVCCSEIEGKLFYVALKCNASTVQLFIVFFNIAGFMSLCVWCAFCYICVCST